MKNSIVFIFLASFFLLQGHAFADYSSVIGKPIINCSNNDRGEYSVVIFLDDYNSEVTAELSVNSIDGPIQVSTYKMDGKPRLVSRQRETIVEGPGFRLLIDNGSHKGSIEATLDHGRIIKNFNKLKCKSL